MRGFRYTTPHEALHGAPWQQPFARQRSRAQPCAHGATVAKAARTSQGDVSKAKNGGYSTYPQIAGTYKIIALYGNAANTLRFDIDGQPASECMFPVATGSMHIWNKAEIGEITFSRTGRHLLTLRYNKGNNLASFEFVLLKRT